MTFCIPRIDFIDSAGEKYTTLSLIVVIGVIAVVVLLNLFALCKKSFSYRRDGINETIEFNVISFATLIGMGMGYSAILLARASQIWQYDYSQDHKDASIAHIQNFTDLLVEISVIFVNDIYLYGSIVWLRMIYDAEKKPKFQRLKKIIKITGVYIMNPVMLCSLLALHVYLEDYLTPTIVIVVCGSVFVEALFLYCCIKLFKYWGSFELPENRCVNNFRCWLYVIVVTSLLRMLLFVVELIARIISGSSDSKCEQFKPLAGSLVMLAYTLVMEVIPIAVLLLLFKFKFNARRLDDHSMNMMLHTQSEIA